MAHLILPFGEALELVRGVRPLPRQLRSASCRGDTILLKLNPEGLLPGFLRAFSADIALALRFREYSSGVARFDLETKLFSLPATSLVNIVLRLVSRVGARGVRLEAPKAPGASPRLSITLQALLDEHMSGVLLEAFEVRDGAFVVTARVEGFRPRGAPATSEAAPAPAPEEAS
ncbi:MAG: hypothetical protein M3498_14500 [Deinococcota bacterium]|jgi:hypothetical protein|nr:hypothetical protein [Deinococcota bacterium]